MLLPTVPDTCLDFLSVPQPSISAPHLRRPHDFEGNKDFLHVCTDSSRGSKRSVNSKCVNFASWSCVLALYALRSVKAVFYSVTFLFQSLATLSYNPLCQSGRCYFRRVWWHGYSSRTSRLRTGSHRVLRRREGSREPVTWGKYRESHDTNEDTYRGNTPTQGD